jgi:hypothetical protein
MRAKITAQGERPAPEEGSSKFGISDTEPDGGATPHLRPLQPGAPHSSLARQVRGDDTARFSAQTGVLYHLDVSAGRPRTARIPSSVTLESPEALVPFQEPSAGPHKRQSSVPYSGFSPA